MTRLTLDNGVEIPASLLDSSIDPIGIHVDGRWAFINRAFARLLGDPPLSSVIGTPAISIVPDEEHPEILAARERVCAGSPPEVVEHSILRRDGGRVRVHASASMLALEGYRAFLVIAREISEPDRFHAQLARSEARFKAVVEQGADAVLVHRDEQILYANPAALRMLGYDDPRALVGENLYDTVLHAEDRAPVRAAREPMDRGELKTVIARWVCRDGSLITIEGSRKEIVWDGEPAYLVVGRDVTEQQRVREERRRAEDALRASEARYRTLFEASPQPVMLFDVETTRFLAVNEAALRVYGFSREEFLAMTLLELKESSDVPELMEGLREIKKRERSREPLCGLRRHRTKSGKILDVDICVHGLTIDGHSAALAVCTDVTERRRLEEQLRQSQKMDAIGRLAGGIAHDFNNILAVILGCADAAARKLEGTAARDEVQEIHVACQRAAGLTRQLLSFTRNQPTHATVLRLDAVIAEFQTMLSRVIGEDIEIRTALSAPCAKVEADRAQIEQLLLNLVINARDAMQRGGVLSISTGLHELASVDADALGVRPGRYVRLSVTDSGCGMDEATRARIFEPFFTTKAVGKGTGLGLAMVFAIVQRFGGGIACTSAVARGTTFDVYLPHVDVAASEAHIEHAPPLSARAAGTVLLVEDQRMVRSVLTRLLRAEGYDVREAANAEAALEILRTGAEEIDMMVTDLVMPGISGRALAEQVRASHPHLKVVYMSGYADERAVELLPDDSAPFLQKPFAAAELFAVVRSALAGERRRPT